MRRAVRLQGWEKDVLRALYYMVQEDELKPLPLSEAAERAIGPDRIHPDKLESLARKFVSLGYGRGERREYKVPTFDVDFTLNQTGLDTGYELVKKLEYKSPLERVGGFNWSAFAAVISAISAIASAYFAYQAGK